MINFDLFIALTQLKELQELRELGMVFVLKWLRMSHLNMYFDENIYFTRMIAMMKMMKMVLRFNGKMLSTLVEHWIVLLLSFFFGFFFLPIFTFVVPFRHDDDLMMYCMIAHCSFIYCMIWNLWKWKRQKKKKKYCYSRMNDSVEYCLCGSTVARSSFALLFSNP